MTVVRTAYHGWNNSWLLSNGMVEAVVVPAIGRVMQFRLAGEPEGVFWENRELDGKPGAGTDGAWRNFGGDKCWPSPQSSWLDWYGRDWPPPDAFDAGPMAARDEDGEVVLISPMDLALGIQLTRRIALDPHGPVMRIRSEYRKIQGVRATAAIWAITQMRDPERVAMLLPEDSKFTAGYVGLMEGEPEDLQFEGRVVSLGRNPTANVKIGSDASSVAWIGPESALRIDAEVSDGTYPDGGCVTEIYTNGDPQAYVELETLGPLTELHVGDWMERTTKYTLTPRHETDVDAEVRRLFFSDSGR